MLEPRKITPRNMLIKGTEPTISLEEAIAFREISHTVLTQLKPEEKADSMKNFKWLPEPYIYHIHRVYGEEGLFKLQFLAMAHGEEEFQHFMEVIKGEIIHDKLLSGSNKTDVNLILDNQKLPACKLLDNFNIYFCQPSLSRKIYNPGRRHGYLSYGLGDPRILVSHPFKGADSKTETYDIYTNSMDILTSLLLRGYRGTFLFLDYLPGLNYIEKGVPAWLHWFSIISIHSDLVLFIKDPSEELGASQKLESEFTPPFIQKKIEEIPFDEFKWAKKAETKAEKIIRFSDQGEILSKEAFYAKEASYAKPFIDMYVEGDLPKDKYIKMLENGKIEEYPRGCQIYS